MLNGQVKFLNLLWKLLFLRILPKTQENLKIESKFDSLLRPLDGSVSVGGSYEAAQCILLP